MESLTRKILSAPDSAIKESRTEPKHQSLLRKKFKSKDRRQEYGIFPASASTKQENSKKTKNNVETNGQSGLSSKFKYGNSAQHFGSNESYCERSIPLLPEDSCTENVSITKFKPKASAKSVDETPSKLISSVSQFENKYTSSTLIKGTGYKFLESLLEKDPMDVVIKLASSKIEFIDFLKKEMFPDLILLTVRILAEKVCVVGFQHKNKTTILTAACNPHFLKQLEEQINKIPREHQSRKSKILPFLENLLIFYETIVNVLPQTACEKFPSLFVTTKLSIDAAQMYQNMNCSDIKKKFEYLNAQLKYKMEEYKCRSIKQTKNIEELQYLQPPDNFRYCSIFPTTEDFVNKPFLRPNIVKGTYIDVEHYLDVQFRLLREDFVGPLRESISKYKKHCLQGLKSSKTVANVRIYHGAKFLNTVTVKGKVGVLLNFDSKKKMKNICCGHSKSFMFGSLLCFTQNNFVTFFFGTVLDSSVKQLKKGCIVVELCDKIFINIFDRTFTMAESEVYFEPYRHILNALRAMPFTEFPMKNYIVDGTKEVGLPLYILKNPSSVYNINGFKVPVTKMDAWPTENELHLDISQYKSLKSALTKEFAIIQGPPGTGKTFLGLKIMQIFLENQSIWNSDFRPILLVCFTNHALDQFLEGILKYTRKIIRVGGQSQSEALKLYNLMKVRQSRAVRVYSAQIRQIFKQKQHVITCIHALQRDIEKIANNLGVVSIYSLMEMGITAEQRESFMSEYVVSDVVFIKWLMGNTERRQPVHMYFGDNHKVPGGGYLVPPKPDHLFQQNCYNSKILKDLPREYNNGEDNSDEEEEEEEEEEDDDDDDDDDGDDDDYNIQVIEPVDTMHFKYALDLSQLRMDVVHSEQQLKSGDYSKDSIMHNIGQFNISNYRFFKDYLTQVVDMDGCVVERLTNVHDLWSLNTDERWCLYKHWCRCLHSTLMKKWSQLQAKYEGLCMQLDEIRDSEDLKLMQDALVVGMTTTGAARRKSLLQKLKPRIVIVEEAAEVLESHVVVSLTKSCEHLILIGDHKQLRPSTAVYELAKKFNLEISLFERMLQNGIHYDCLELQHRMRPEIANLITPTIYPSLRCGPSVYKYENVKGVKKNMFFINHKFYEEEVRDTFSRRNPFEAEFLIAFCRYLLLQGYKETEITILTTYSAQMFYMQTLQKKYADLQNVQITVVDNFQGEENKIILLSLVRSNEDANIGFLKVENRVCVALSRAREGFYVIGNMDNLTKSSKIWPKINKTLLKQDAIGSHLTLKCQVHQIVEIKVSSAADFKAVHNGGCILPCEFKLPCGHKCRSRCHILDRDHKNYRCFCIRERNPVQHVMDRAEGNEDALIHAMIVLAFLVICWLYGQPCP